MNRSNTNLQAVLSTKLLLMTFLRTGALVRLQWKWFELDYPDTITIPGDTPGSKRKKGKNDHISHYAPVNPQTRKVILVLIRTKWNSKHMFQPIRERRFNHLDPSARNHYLRSIGYKDALRAYGWRSSGTASIPCQGGWVGSSALLIFSPLHTSCTEAGSIWKGMLRTNSELLFRYFVIWM